MAISDFKGIIDATIKTNGRQEITGASLNEVLTQMVDATDAELAKLSAEVGMEFNDLLKFTESQVLTIDLYIKKGTTFLWQLTSASSWNQLGVFYGERWTGGVRLEYNAVNGETYEFTAGEDIQSLKFFLISAPSFVMDVQVSITPLGLSQQLEGLSQQLEGLSRPITTDRLADESVSLQKTTFATLGKNLFNKENYQIGVLYNGNIYDSTPNYREYLTSDYIPVSAGEKYIYSNNGTAKGFERAEVYDKNKVFLVSGVGSLPFITIPTDGAFLRFSIRTTTDSALWQTSQFEKGTIATEYEPYGFKISESVLPIQNAKPHKPYISNYAETLPSGATLKISDAPNAKINHTIGCGMAIASMGRIRISHGKAIYSFGAVEIDATNIYEFASGDLNTPTKTTPHGLAIQEFVRVAIIKDSLYNATIIVTSLTGEYTQQITWRGCTDAVELYAMSGEYHNISLTMGGCGFKKDIWIFGDSYADYWLPNLYDKNITDFYADAHSGRKSASAYTSFVNALKLGTPKTLVWMMGMNDGDTGVINANYKGAFDAVKALCDKHGIAFVPCTIPNCSQTHIYKNAYIRAHSDNYIDMAKILGADSEGSTWYEGLISSDNVHPSNQGKAVIANALIEYVF